MPIPVIQSVTNVGDGLNLDATMQAAPTGALTFRRSILPGIPGTLVPAVHQGGNVYRVQVRDGSYDSTRPDRDQRPLTNRRFYYLTAYDGTDEADEQNGQWLCVGSNDDLLTLCEDTMLGIIRDNALAVEQSMRIAMRSDRHSDRSLIKVLKIHQGMPEAEKDAKNPSVAVRCFNDGVELAWGIPYTDKMPVRGAIHCYYVHQSNHSQERLVRGLAKGIMDVVNTVSYIEMPLWLPEPQLRASKLYIPGVTISETFNEEAGIVITAGDMEWSCEIVWARPE